MSIHSSIMGERVKDTIEKLKKLSDEKDSLLDYSTGPAREQLMYEIGLLRKSSSSLEELWKTKKALEELLEINWKHENPSDEEIIMSGDI